MEFDQSFNGASVDWNFPSPTATPTHGSFGSSVFQTPKTSTFPTHFQDAFTTPQMSSYTTPQQAQYASMTPIQRSQTSSDTLRSNYYANIQAAAGHNGQQGMLPPGQMDPNISMSSPTYVQMGAGSMQMPASGSFGSMQMQTPPPTRGTSNRKPQHAQDIAFGTPSTIASRRFLTPQHSAVPMNNASLMQHTPIQFPQIQFSPDMYQFANLGPASAPVMPQSRIFWDQQESPMQPVSQPALDDPFAPGYSPSIGWLNGGSQPVSSQNAALTTPDMQSFPVQAPAGKPFLTRRMTDQFGMSTNDETTSTGVDPSLLYTGPVRQVVRSNNKPVRATQKPSTADVVSQAHNRTETMSSTDTVITRPKSNLQRSKTSSVGRPKSVLMSLTDTESLSRRNSISQVPRTASPVKRIGRPSLGAASEGRPRQRTSVILTVDEHGMARTETKRVDESPTRSIRERYPALFDSDSSDDESNASEQIPSRPSSFIFDKRDERKSKAARLDPPVENLEGLSIPRTGSAASMKKGVQPSRAVLAATAQLRRQGSLRRSTPSRNSRRNLASSSSTSLIDTCPMDVPSEDHRTTSSADRAENIPSQMPDDGSSWASNSESFDIPPSSAERALDVHNRRWSMMSFEQQQQRPAQISPQQQPYYHPVLSSPPMPPPQLRSLQIRCQCGFADDRGQALVQCRSCTQWAHAGCVGLENQPPPFTFICFLCTKPSPSRPFSGARPPVSG